LANRKIKRKTDYFNSNKLRFDIEVIKKEAGHPNNNNINNINNSSSNIKIRIEWEKGSWKDFFFIFEGSLSAHSKNYERTGINPIKFFPQIDQKCFKTFVGRWIKYISMCHCTFSFKFIWSTVKLGYNELVYNKHSVITNTRL